MPAIAAQPYDFEMIVPQAALLIIDMQRDFLEPGGFGAMLGNDVTQLRHTIEPTLRMLTAARQAGMLVVHTREGHRPDLSDLPDAKRRRGKSDLRIGDRGPMGRILIHGEAGHGIIPELEPAADEPVIDKPGKGAFFATGLEALLRGHAITQLLVCGVTTEVCVSTTIREANDRGFECLLLEDCTASYTPSFHEQSLRMITAQGGIFGWVGHSSTVIGSLPRSGETLEPPIFLNPQSF